MAEILFRGDTLVKNRLRSAEKEDVALIALKEFGRALMQKGVISSCYIQSAQVDDTPDCDCCDRHTYYFLKVGSAAIARVMAQCMFVYVKEPYLYALSESKLTEIFGDGYVASWDYNRYTLLPNTGIPQVRYEV